MPSEIWEVEVFLNKQFDELKIVENVCLIIIKWLEVHVRIQKVYIVICIHLNSKQFVQKTYFLIFYKMSILYFNHKWYAWEYKKCENLNWNALLFEISLSFFDWSGKLAVGNNHNRQFRLPFIIPLLSLFIFS